MVIKLSIPSDTQLLVETGQKISLGEPLIEESTTEELSVTISSNLGIKPQDIFQYCSVLVGDSVAPGDILAQKKHLLSHKKVTCETIGVVKHIDHTTGTMTLTQASANKQHITSPVAGEIRDINPDEGTISIEIGPADQFPAHSSQDCGGKWVYLTQKDIFSCDEDDIRDGCIFIHTSQTHVTSKMEALGARCIMAVDGPDPEIPCIRISEEDAEKISQTSHTHVVYSVHDTKLYAYTPTT